MLLLNNIACHWLWTLINEAFFIVDFYKASINKEMRIYFLNCIPLPKRSDIMSGMQKFSVQPLRWTLKKWQEDSANITTRYWLISGGLLLIKLHISQIMLPPLFFKTLFWSSRSRVIWQLLMPSSNYKTCNNCDSPPVLSFQCW